MTDKKVQIIDGHTHAWQLEDMPGLKKSIRMLDGDVIDPDSPHNWSPCFDGSLDSLIQAERSAGVDRFVLLPVSARVERCRELTRWVAEEAQKHPEIIPFASIHPHTQTPEDDVAAFVDLGLRGVKLHSLVQMFDPLCPEALRTYEAMEKHELVLLMDSMNLEGAVAFKPNLAPLMETATSMKLETGPRQISEVANRFPGLRIIAAHFGYLYGWDKIDLLYPLDRVYLDMAYIHRLVTPEEAVAIIRKKGADRIIYGSDAPYRRPDEALDWFLNLPLTPREQSAILSGNLNGLLNGTNP